LLVERYRQYVYQVIFSVLRHAKDAEDVTQECFVKAYYALPQYKYQGFKTWLTRIAMNKAIDQSRKTARHTAHLDASPEPAEGEAAQESDEVEPQVLRKERSELVRRRIGEMPEGYRDVMTAYYLQDKTFKEIASELGMEPKSVEVKLYRAKQWFRKHWKEEEFH
jgi:RNA polymerase sigma factor (sigma-70 family)